MSTQQLFSRFHKEIKVETDELRDKRDILIDKIKTSLKKKGHPLPDLINQGSYIYGVGVKPVSADVEYDIDVGLDFPIKSEDHSASEIRKWVYDAVSDHTDNVEDRGPCIRVRYAAGYHVDLVVYARFKDNDETTNYHLAYKDDNWRPGEPRKLKSLITDARKSFTESKDSSGSDQLQRVTRYLKRWNDFAIPNDSPDKPFGLATLLLVMKYFLSPVTVDGMPNDLEALIKIVRNANAIYGRIVILKPTQEFEDVFGKLSDDAMEKFKSRLRSLLSDLELVRSKDDDYVATVLRKQFGSDFPKSLEKNEDGRASIESKDRIGADLTAAIPSFTNPSRPWCHE